MEIKKAHCFFEQSGTFKNEFIKLGIPSEDYDIQNEYGETDNVVDLFVEIKKAYINEESIFDRIKKDDLIIAFFPCIYFCENNNLYFTGQHLCLKDKDLSEKIERIIERSRNRQLYYELILFLVHVCSQRGLRLIIENPYDNNNSYLTNNFIVKPSIIDRNRTLRGDKYRKPTMYYFINCEPTYGCSFTPTPTDEIKTIQRTKGSSKKDVCSRERSEISPIYARNFINDFILGKVQEYTQLSLF